VTSSKDRTALKLLLAAALALLPACSSDDEDGDGEAAAAGSAGTGVDLNLGGSNASSGGAAQGSTGNITANGCELRAGGEECAAQGYEGESLPLDIFVMFDQSGSMLNDVGGVTRMQAVQLAAEQFLRDPKSQGIGFGIGYFGTQPIGSASCAEADYSQPQVEITLDHEAVISSLAGRVPTGETPTGAAIRGGCTYAQAHKMANPSHSVVVLLLTDGEPKAPVTCQSGSCCPTLADAVAAADECRSSNPAIRTYVLGVGPFLENLQQIASAGGTDQAYLVGDQDVATNVLAALNAIRADATIPCEIKLPDAPNGQMLDHGKVNIAYQDSSCAMTTLYYVEQIELCDPMLGGWYYDDPTLPTSVQLCPSSCDQVAIPGGRLALTIGCQTQVPVF
jgi:von Willebrand factor type A domain